MTTSAGDDELLGALRRGVSQVLREQHEVMRQTLAGLDEDALNWAPAPETNSIAVLFTHTLGAEDSISATLLGEPIDRDRDAEFRTRISDPGQLLAKLNEVEERVVDRVQRLGPTDLAAEKSPPRDRLGRKLLGSWWFAHLVEHNREHIAQAGLTRQLYEHQSRS